MLSINNKVSTGLKGFDEIIDMLRLGDNVVWQVQSIEDYRQIVEPYIRRTLEDGRKLIYFRFGNHAPLMESDVPTLIYHLDASDGFECFAAKVHNYIEQEGEKAFYVFDCLTDLLRFWYSDLTIGNFFKVTCPFLYQLNTIAYFAVIRNAHTYDTIARIRETTQLLLDLYNINEKLYIHPLKVWERYSPTMFFPHLMQGDKAVSITGSSQAAELFASLGWNRQAQDYWEATIQKAREALEENEKAQEQAKKLLLELIIGKEVKILALCNHYFTLQDLLDIAAREIGTGFIGGKSVGMLLARKILQTDAWPVFQEHWEPHDSYYLGADVFYTYIVQNGWWELYLKQKAPEGYTRLAPVLQKNLLKGKFPEIIREQFTRMLEYYGQSPIIARSSSLLEDNYGNAFAGKYDSVFCTNQGTPEERYAAFEQAVRTVYASAMNKDALAYRVNRGLENRDEQIAILIQRVSGDHYQDAFFPHIAGVGNSVNLYVWDKYMDINAGMLRLVFGLGTRAVDRVSGDYARIVALDNPAKLPPVSYGDEKKFSQHNADILNLRKNRMEEIPLEEIYKLDIKTDKEIFFSPDLAAQNRLQELGVRSAAPVVLDFKYLLTRSKFLDISKTALSVLEKAYKYPVDIEFTANFLGENSLRFNLLQCRPLQTKCLGKAVEIPKPPVNDVFFATRGNFMGGNVRLVFDYVILIKAQEYINLSQQDKYQVARLVGNLNNELKDHRVLLLGPGRLGTTTPSLGVPVHFAELCHMAAVCEVSHKESGLIPEVSLGSHFFQDIVESDIFYAAIFDGEADVVYHPEYILAKENLVEETLRTEKYAEKQLAQTVHLARTPGLTLYSDIVSQQLLCF